MSRLPVGDDLTGYNCKLEQIINNISMFYVHWNIVVIIIRVPFTLSIYITASVFLNTALRYQPPYI
jgi:hypothetical protein